MAGPVSNVDELKQMIAQAGNSIALLIQRDNAQIFVPSIWADTG